MSKSLLDKTKVLVLISDPHVGAAAGLLPPDFVSFEGNPIGQNNYQKWLWECWLDCWQWAGNVIGKDEWAACINGDLIDGFHHNTREIVSVDTADHVDACLQVFTEVLSKASAVYLTEGTNVHTQNSEHGIASTLKHRGLNVVTPPTKRSAWPELDLMIHGCHITIDHHVSTTARSYLESGAYSTTLGDIRNRRSRAGWPIPKLIVRAHRHQYGMFSDGYGTMLITPPWQGATRFTRRVVPGSVPQCGLVIADWRNCEYADEPVIHKRLHTVKKPTPVFL